MSAASNPPSRPRVGILLFDQVEPLDFAGPLEVLACSRDVQGRPLFQVCTLAARERVDCAGGLAVLAQLDLGQAPPLEALIVPGGPGARRPSDPGPVLAFLRAQAQAVPLMASVCTGAYWLARAGLLDGVMATTHASRLEDFAAEFPTARVARQKVVDQGRIITAAGVASGIDLALHILERYHGPEARAREARRLDGPWT